MAGLIHFSEAVNLGLHALLLLAATPAAARDNRRLAADLGVSANHLSKVLQRLQHAGLVTSTRGPAGGFRLAHRPQDVSLLTVYEALEGPLTHRTCLLSRPHCPAGGFRLAHRPQDVSLLTVYEALEGPLTHRTCLLSRPHCPAGSCVFGSLLADTTRAFEQHLRRTTLATVATPKPSSPRKR